MFIVNYMSDLLTSEKINNVDLTVNLRGIDCESARIYIRAHNCEVSFHYTEGYGYWVTINELNGAYIRFSFEKIIIDPYRKFSVKELLRYIFRIDDIDLALYMIRHTYHANGRSLDAVFKHPLYSMFVNSDRFTITAAVRERVYSPFKVNKPVNLNTRLTHSKIIKAIFAGQITKVVCTRCDHDLYYDDEQKVGEWDPIKYAEYLGNGNINSFQHFYNEGPIISSIFMAGNYYYESFELYIKE